MNKQILSEILKGIIEASIPFITFAIALYLM